MKKIKILGIGSPFGDDQSGWKMIELLKQRKALQDYIPDYLVLETHDRPGIRLLELMENTNTIFLIDAVVTGSKIGKLYRFENEEIEELKCIISSHDIGVAQALQLGRALNQLPEQLIFYGIEINHDNTGMGISFLIESCIHQLVECIETEVLHILRQG